MKKLELGSIKQRFNTFLKRLTVKKVFLGCLAYAWLFTMVILVMTPILWMVSAAFTDTRYLQGVPIYPRFAEWSLENYRRLFVRPASGQPLPEYLRAFLTTFIIAVTNTVMVVLLSSLVGFAFSRYRFKGKKRVLLGMMALQMFPSFMGMLALFMFYRQFGLLNNPFALAFIYIAGAIPYNTFIVRGYMRNVPKSLDEAAAIDGATNLQIMLKILFPLAVPIMGFIAVNAFMAPWLDFILPSVIMPQRDTVAVYLYRLLDVTSDNYRPVQFMAGALFLAVPIMIVQIYMQKYLIYGLTAGADKG